jgi:hypothetical protein
LLRFGRLKNPVENFFRPANQSAAPRSVQSVRTIRFQGFADRPRTCDLCPGNVRGAVMESAFHQVRIVVGGLVCGAAFMVVSLAIAQWF